MRTTNTHVHDNKFMHSENTKQAARVYVHRATPHTVQHEHPSAHINNTLQHTGRLTEEHVVHDERRESDEREYYRDGREGKDRYRRDLRQA